MGTTETLGPAISEEDTHAASALAVEGEGGPGRRVRQVGGRRRTIPTELELSHAELEKTENEVQGVKKRLKEVWRMNCDQTISYDEELTAKDAEIAELKVKLSAAPATHRRSDHGDLVAASSDGLPRTASGAAGSRCGKAPPVDTFSGDDGVTRFDDWYRL